MNPLTDEQIRNWRKVMSLMIGPEAHTIPVEDIEKMRAQMQREVDRSLPAPSGAGDGR